MNTTGVDDDVAAHIQQSSISPNTFSAPVSLTIRLPETMPLDQGEAGSGGGSAGAEADGSGSLSSESGSLTDKSPESLLRGTPLNLTIAGPERATVGELISAMLEEAAGMGLRPRSISTQRVRYGQPTCPNPLYYRDGLLDWPRAMGI